MERAARAFAALAVILGAALAGAPPASADVKGPCVATINGHDLGLADTPARAVEVGADDNVVVDGLDATGAPFTKVGLKFWPFPAFNVVDKTSNPPKPSWGGTVKVKDYAKYGVGLYNIIGSTEDCSVDAWVKVTGKSPVTTAVGIGGAVLGGVGLLGIGFAIAKALGGVLGWGSILRGMRAGIPLGLGAALLAHQAGVEPLTLTTVGAFGVAGASAGGLMTSLLAGLRPA